jgi:hypothetical protein
MRFLIAAPLLVDALAAGYGGGGDGSDAGGEERRERDLVVQTAEGGGFVDGGQGLTLTLRPVSAVTTTFSERPARDAGRSRPPTSSQASIGPSATIHPTPR